MVYQCHASKCKLLNAEKVLFRQLFTNMGTEGLFMSIDQLSENIISSFNEDDREQLKEATKFMLHKMKHHEGMFSVVKRPYIVAKSLYFMLTEDYLSSEEQMSAVKLVYFCLLNNYLKNCDSKHDEARYEDLVSGCKLALVLFSMQNKFLMYSVIAGQAGYINPETHLRNQMLLFGGIAKESETAHEKFPLEDIINQYYVDIFKELQPHLPIGIQLAAIKDQCTPVIKSIKRDISINFKDLDDF